MCKVKRQNFKIVPVSGDFDIWPGGLRVPLGQTLWPVGSGAGAVALQNLPLQR